uniref:Uncharacterized protein n=1 Tax=Myxococcus fulvus TaxID=33 RepID=B0YR13_MYXFU|nr:hypothetical protein pMF1.4 [Myxococcus fulvus]
MPNLNTTVAFRKGLQQFEKDVGFQVGQMVAPAGTVTDAVCMEFQCSVSTTSAVGALTMVERLQVLSKIRASFAQILGEDAGGLRLDPIQGQSLDNIRLDAIRLLGLDMDGLEDNTTGLAKAFAVGSNQVTFKVFLPVGHLEKVAESAYFTGLSPEQLLDCELTVTRDVDPFQAVKSALTSTIKVLFAPGTKKAEARRIGLMPHCRSITNAESDTLATPEGLVLDFSHMAPMQDKEVKAMSVRVGNVLVTDVPSTPEHVYADFLRKFPSISAAEKTLTATRTPIFLAEPNVMTRMHAGRVEAKVQERTAEWDGRVLYVPLHDHAQVFALVRTYAKRIESGRHLLAVNTAMYEGLDIEDRLLPYVGMTVFLNTEEGFSDFPGIYCKQGGEPYVTVPEHRLRQAAVRVADAMRSTTTHPNGNRDLVKSVVNDEARWVPGAVTHGDGLRVSSKVRQDVQALIRDAAIKYAETLGKTDAEKAAAARLLGSAF